MRLHEELQDLCLNSCELYEKELTEDFINYFNEKGFIKSETVGAGTAMKYKKITAYLSDGVAGIFTFEMSGVFKHTICVHQRRSKYIPTHVNENEPLENRIAHEVEMINDLKSEVTRFSPYRYHYLTLDKSLKEYDGFSDIADKLIENKD